MAEPRKVQFVTLSAFVAGGAAESRKRRLEDGADFNFDTAGELEATSGAGDAASNGRLGKTGDGDTAAAEGRATVRLNLPLSEPDERSSAEFNYGELIQNLQVKSSVPAHKPNNPFSDEEEERLQVEALAKKFEKKYGNTGKKRKDRMQDLIDIGFGYDETDPFIDNSEAYDELVPASLSTKLGGFYINTGTLQFRATSDSEGEEDEKRKNEQEQVLKKRKKKEGNDLEEKKTIKAATPGVTPLDLHRPEKKKKKLMKDSLYLASMLRRFTQEKEELRRRNSSAPNAPPGINRTPPGNSSHLLLASSSPQPQGNAAANDLSLAELATDPAVMSLLGSANEKELQDLLSDLDFSLLETDQQHAMVSARENGILGVGVPSHKGGPGRGPGSSSGLFPPPPLPEGLPAPLIKRIEDLRTASRQFDQEGRKKFFTLDMNDILLDIELQVQEQPPEVRSLVYSHMEAFVPCNKEALLKRLKKLSLNIQDDRLRTPLLKLKLAVCGVMPEQIATFNTDCMAKAAKQQSEEGDKNGSEEDDDEKPGKRVIGPRKKFIWDDKLRNLLCSLVRVKLSCYEMEKQCSLSVEDYLKAFLENEVKPLWPKGWMQARILFKESLPVHHHLTGNLVRRRMMPAAKAKTKECLWIHKPPLAVTSTPSLLTSTSAQSSARLPTSCSPSEPICLSDSLDEDLTAPSLDSISHALALLSNASRGLGPADSPLSPPPLQIPTSSPPPVAPHYPSALAAPSTPQHSLVKAEAAPPGAVPAGKVPPATLANPSSTSATPAASSAARVSLPPRTADGHFMQVKGLNALGQSQTHRLVTMATSNHRPNSVMTKMNARPSPSSPKLQSSSAPPLLPPHQKVFTSPGGILGSLATAPGLSKGGAKPGGASSNGAAVNCIVTPSSSPSSLPRPASTSHHGLQSFCPSSAGSSAPSLLPQSSHPPQSKAQTQPPHHHHQPNFITPMQATLTKSSHSSNSSPIIKLTPPPPSDAPQPAAAPPILSEDPQNLSAPLQRFGLRAGEADAGRSLQPETAVLREQQSPPTVSSLQPSRQKTGVPLAFRLSRSEAAGGGGRTGLEGGERVGVFRNFCHVFHNVPPVAGPSRWLRPPGKPLRAAAGLRDVGRSGPRVAPLSVPLADQLQLRRRCRIGWHGFSPQLQLRIPVSTERPHGSVQESPVGVAGCSTSSPAACFLRRQPKPGWRSEEEEPLTSCGTKGAGPPLLPSNGPEGSHPFVSASSGREWTLFQKEFGFERGVNLLSTCLHTTDRDHCGTSASGRARRRAAGGAVGATRPRL